MKIFIVDDSAFARGMLINLLKVDSNVEIVGEAASGQAAIIMFDEVNPDIIMIEASIAGGMDVVDVIKEIRKINKTVQIILCADPKTFDIVIPSAEIGADDFISKPYTKATIKHFIKEMKEKLGM